MAARLRTFLNHPATKITVAVILVVTSLAEGWEDFIKDLFEFNAGVHHGVLVFGFVQLLRAFSETVEAAQRVAKVKG